MIVRSGDIEILKKVLSEFPEGGNRFGLFKDFLESINPRDHHDLDGLLEFLQYGFETFTEKDQQKFLYEFKNSIKKKEKKSVRDLSKFYRDVISTNFNIRFNEVKCRQEILVKNEGTDSGVWKNFEDEHLNRILTYIREQHNQTVSKNNILELVNGACMRYHNPFEEYFRGREWDKTDYIQELADTVKTRDDFKAVWENYLKKWLVGVVATMLCKGVNHQCLVLQGEQGIYKSTWLNKLVPKELYDYGFCGWLDPKNKDSEILTSEKFLINLDELESTTRAERSYLKSLITKEKINQRRPYAEFNSEMLKRASFCGSIDRDEFLDDMEGTRRWLVVPIENIKIDQLTKELIRGVWSQAYSLFREGFKYYFEKEDIRIINANNHEFKMISMEEELLLKKYHTSDVWDEELTASEIMMAIQKDVPGAKLNVRILSRLLKRRGFRFRETTRGRVFRVRRGETYDKVGPVKTDGGMANMQININ